MIVGNICNSLVIILYHISEAIIRIIITRISSVFKTFRVIGGIGYFHQAVTLIVSVSELVYNDTIHLTVQITEPIYISDISVFIITDIFIITRLSIGYICG